MNKTDGLFRIKMKGMFACAGEDDNLYVDPAVGKDDADRWTIDPVPNDERPNARM